MQLLAVCYLVVVGVPRELELHPRIVERENVPQGFFIVVQLPEPENSQKTRP